MASIGEIANARPFKFKYKPVTLPEAERAFDQAQYALAMARYRAWMQGGRLGADSRALDRYYTAAEDELAKQLQRARERLRGAEIASSRYRPKPARGRSA